MRIKLTGFTRAQTNLYGIEDSVLVEKVSGHAHDPWFTFTNGEGRTFTLNGIDLRGVKIVVERT